MKRSSAVFVRTDRALFIGPRSETALHSHHALELSIALDNRGVDVACPGGPSLTGCPGAMVRAGVEHRLAIPGPRVAVLYVDPHCLLAAGLTHWLDAEPLRALPAEQVRESRRLMSALLDTDEPEWEAAMASLTSPFYADSPAPKRDHRVEKSKQLIEAHLAEPLSLPELAERVGLSGSRLRHLFKTQVGLPIRSYVLWMRLRAALLEALSGRPMTEAAVVAGFADAAHFTRTCRRMFGLPPSAFAPVDAVYIS